MPDTGLYLEKVKAGVCAVGAREVMTPEIRVKERIMFGLRTREGVAAALLEESGRKEAVVEVLAEGLAEWKEGRLVLTRRGRLLADSVAGFFV